MGTVGILAELAQHLQAPAAPLPPEGVAGVGDVPQLVQDEAGDDQGALEEARLSHVGDAPVDDGAGVHEDTAVQGGGPPEALPPSFLRTPRTSPAL